jgi:hypothetical protein
VREGIWEARGGFLLLSRSPFSLLSERTETDTCSSPPSIAPFLREQGQYWVDVARVAEAARQHFDDLVAAGSKPSHRQVGVPASPPPPSSRPSQMSHGF